MGRFLILLLALQFLCTATLSKVMNAAPASDINSLNEHLKDYSLVLPDELLDHEQIDEVELPVNDGEEDDVPLIQTYKGITELKFRQPIESVNVDYTRNAVILKFLHKKNEKSVLPTENAYKEATKRSYEEYASANNLPEDGGLDKEHGMRLERSQQTARDARGDNFMRFGRSDNVKNDFMRFGRSGSQDFMRFGRDSTTDNFMRFGRSPHEDFMRFGRSPNQDFMRFGHSPHEDFMRFGRSGQDNFMRFGRNSLKPPKTNSNFMRYSRPDNFMRFGRSPQQIDDNFMRFGKSMQNANDRNDSKPLVIRNELKQAVKLIHEADKNVDNENPVDKAMKVLFDKHRQQDLNNSNKDHSDEESTTYQHNNNNVEDTAGSDFL